MAKQSGRFNEPDGWIRDSDWVPFHRGWSRSMARVLLWVLCALAFSPGGGFAQDSIERTPDYSREGWFSNYDPDGIEERQQVAAWFGPLSQSIGIDQIVWFGYRSPEATRFRLRMYDGESQPGNVVWEETITPSRVPTGQTISGHIVYEFQTVVDPRLRLDAAPYWFSVASEGTNFVWLRSLPVAEAVATRTLDAGAWSVKAENGGVAFTLRRIYPQESTLDLEVVVEGSAVTLSIAAGIAPDLDPTVAGIDVRRWVGGDCDSETLLTTTPITWGEPGEHIFVIEDVLQADRIHRYELVVVDANRQALPLDMFMVERSEGHAVRGSGDDVVGHGTLVDRDGDSWLEPCPGSCWSPLQVFGGPDVLAYVDSGIEIQLTGFLSLGNILAIAVEEVDCPGVTMETTSWGALKSRF